LDFHFTKEQNIFRKEVRNWLKEEIPPKWAEIRLGIWEENDEIWAMARNFERKLANKGWLAAGYPKRYGGMDATPMEQAILSEEKARARAPATGGDMLTVGWVGPTIMIHGTEEQKDQYVGGIGRGELVFCLGYSEPNAGSDLANVQTLAKEDGDDYLINGQKIFTSLAHRADYCWLAARTDPDAPKHKGISMFVVDLKTPGITVRPLINIFGSHHFNEVFFDDARVSKENMVGEKNLGWYTLATALNYERSGVSMPTANIKTIERLTQYVKETPWEDGVLFDNPLIRNKLAQMTVENEVCRLICYRAIWMQSMGKVPAHEASMSFLLGSELSRKLANTGMEILGEYGQLHKGSKWAALEGIFANMYISTLPLGIGGGTLEIQRNLIALLGLGLPRQ